MIWRYCQDTIFDYNISSYYNISNPFKYSSFNFFKNFMVYKVFLYLLKLLNSCVSTILKLLVSLWYWTILNQFLRATHFFTIFISDIVCFYLRIVNSSSKNMRIKSDLRQENFFNWISSTLELKILGHNYTLNSFNLLFYQRIIIISSCQSSHFTYMKTMNQAHKVLRLNTLIVFSTTKI